MSFFIHTEADLDIAIARLIDADPRFRAVLSRAGRPPLRRRADGFAGLAAIVVSQQVSTASAKAIWGRLSAAIDPLDQRTHLAPVPPSSCAPAFRRAKIRTLEGDRESRSTVASSTSPRWPTSPPTKPTPP